MILGQLFPWGQKKVKSPYGLERDGVPYSMYNKEDTNDGGMGMERDSIESECIWNKESIWREVILFIEIATFWGLLYVSTIGHEYSQQLIYI